MQYRKQLEDFNVRDMAEKPEEPRFREAWDITLGHLEDFYELIQERDLPLLLIVFPYHFQLLDDSYCGPQRMLKEHAGAHGVDVLDLTSTFRDLIFDDRDETDQTDLYYLDSLHFTARGNRVIAEKIFEYLVQRGLVQYAPDAR